jgi:hypothetical protein
MDKMRRGRCFYMLALSASLLCGCGNGSTSSSVASSSSLAVDLSTLAMTTVDKTLVAEKEKLDVTLKGESVSSYTLSVTHDGALDSASYKVENGTIEYLKTGTFVVSASLPEYGSKKVDETVTVYPSIEEEIKAIPFENLILGKTYSVSPNLVSKLADFSYDTSDASSFLEVTSDNTLKVVGVSRGDLKISRKSSGAVVFNDLAIVKSTVVVAQIRDNLYNAGVLASPGSPASKDDLGKVKSLSFKKTLVDDLDATVSIAACPNLESLTITECNLVNLGFLTDLPKLTNLNLSDNAISDITAIGSCRKLTDLDLSGNAISDATPIRRLDVIANLNLRDNLITDLGPLSSLMTLRKLYLGYNDFAKITDIAGLTDLSDLDLSYSKITFDNAVVFDYFKKLEYLDLSGITIDLTSMPASLPNIHTLKFDNCGLNNYTDLVSVLSNYPSLTGLSLAYDEVGDSDLNEILALKGLTALNLSGNPLSLDESKNTNTFEGMSALTELSLEGCNNIPNLAPLEKIQENLISLDLSGCNSLSDFANVTAFKNLKDLYIQNDFNLLTQDIITSLKTWIGSDPKHPAINIVLLNDGSQIGDFTYYTNLKEFEAECKATGSTYTYTGKGSRIVLSFANEAYDSSLAIELGMVIDLPKSVTSLYLAGLKKHYIHKLAFVAEDRTADLNVAFENIDVTSPDAMPFFSTLGTSTLRCSYYGVLDVFRGGVGETGSTGADYSGNSAGQQGGTGKMGYPTFKSNGGVRLDVYTSITFFGGKGGRGGQGGSGTDGGLFGIGWKYGGAGGNGGTGGYALSANGTATLIRHKQQYVVNLYGGDGGDAGTNGFKANSSGSKGANGKSANVSVNEFFKRSK